MSHEPDGLFDVTVVGDCTRRTLLRVFPRVYKGTHLEHPKVTVHRAARVELLAEGVTGYADGSRSDRCRSSPSAWRGPPAFSDHDHPPHRTMTVHVLGP
nr:hypothetical protein [Streptomyces himalayensis]